MNAQRLELIKQRHRELERQRKLSERQVEEFEEEEPIDRDIVELTGVIEDNYMYLDFGCRKAVPIVPY
jgi:hypothetical protein